MRNYLHRILLLLIFIMPCSALLHAQARAHPETLLLVTDAAMGKISFIDNGVDNGLKKGRAASLHTITLPFPLHARVWHSNDQSHAYLSSPEGWVIKVDMQTREVMPPLRVGTHTSGIALSHDDRFIMAANLQPGTLVAINAGDLSLIRTIEVKDRAGKASGVAALHTAAARKSFIAVMRDIPELWELSYDAHAEPVYEGLVHDYKMGEAIALRGPFPPRRTVLEQALSSFAFDTNFTHAIGASDDGLWQVINLNIRRKIRTSRAHSTLQADAGASWQWQGRPILVLPLVPPQANENALYVIDMQSWQVLRQIAVSGKNIRLHTHANAPYAWIESGDDGIAKKKIALLDKQSMAIVSVTPALISGSSAPLAWPREGAQAILRSMDGKALLLVDTKTLELVQRFDLTDSLTD